MSDGNPIVRSDVLLYMMIGAGVITIWCFCCQIAKAITSGRASRYLWYMYLWNTGGKKDLGKDVAKGVATGGADLEACVVGASADSAEKSSEKGSLGEDKDPVASEGSVGPVGCFPMALAFACPVPHFPADRESTGASSTVRESTESQQAVDSSIEGVELTEPAEAEPNTVKPKYCYEASWWEPARVNEIRDLTHAVPFTNLIAVDLRDAVPAPAWSWTSTSQALTDTPWAPGNSHDLYAKMGANDPNKTYVVWWLSFGAKDLVSVSEVVDQQRLDTMISDHRLGVANPLGQRLKMLLQPVQVRLPFPVKGARDAEPLESFFGKNHCSISSTQTPCGAKVTVLQCDLGSKWLIKKAISTVGFQPGNVIELFLVDWVESCPAAFAGVRLVVTDDFTKRFRG